MKKIFLTWDDIENLTSALCASITFDCKEKHTTPNEYFKGIYAIPRGGLIIGVMMSHKLGIPLIDRLQSFYGQRFLVVDDISDTGNTLSKLKAEIFDNASTATIHWHKDSICKPDYYVSEKLDDWLVYPWENKNSVAIQDYKVL